jgi:hypothetical protein
MNHGFSPFLAHLLMAGLARRAVLSAATRHDPRQNPDDSALPYPPDDLDCGIAAFISGKAARSGAEASR